MQCLETWFSQRVFDVSAQEAVEDDVSIAIVTTDTNVDFSAKKLVRK